jgi:hypothetical protein
MRSIFKILTLLVVIGAASLQPLPGLGGIPGGISLSAGPVTKGLGGPGLGFGFAPGFGVGFGGGVGGVGGFGFGAGGIGIG